MLSDDYMSVEGSHCEGHRVHTVEGEGGWGYKDKLWVMIIMMTMMLMI